MRGGARAGLAGLAAMTLALAGCAATSAEVPPPRPGGRTAELCRTLVQQVPDSMFDQDRLSVRPDSDYVAAWGDPPIALRCGVKRPEGLQPDSELRVVNDVAWLAEPPDHPNLFTAVGREVYVEMTIPPAYGTPAKGLVKIGDLISDTVPALPDGEL